MLPQHFKFHVINNTGATIEFSTDGANNTFTIKARPWKYTSGALAYHTSELTWFADPTADLTSGADLEAASAVDNSTNLFLGAHCTASLETDAAVDGTLDIYYECSTDGGTTYPSDAADFDENVLESDLIYVASIACDSTDDDRSINFELY